MVFQLALEAAPHPPSSSGPGAARRSPADLHGDASAARSGRRETQAHHDACRDYPCSPAGIAPLGEAGPLVPSEEKLEPGKMALDPVLKRNLCPWKEADRYSRFVRRRQAPGGGIPECVVTSLSPTFAGLDRADCSRTWPRAPVQEHPCNPRGCYQCFHRMALIRARYRSVSRVPPRRMTRTERTAAIV
jgi:hypothetical protein